MIRWPFRWPAREASPPSLAFDFTAEGAQVSPQGVDRSTWLESLEPWPVPLRPAILVLRQLVEMEMAETSTEGLRIGHHALSLLEDREVADLGVAQPYPHELHLSEGAYTFGMPEFRFQLEFRAAGRPLPGISRQGCFLLTGGRRWWLRRPAFLLAEAAERANRDATGLLDRQLELWAEIRPLALEAGAILSPYLKTEVVLAPEELELSLVQEPDRSLTVLLKAEGLDEGELREKLDRSHVLPTVLSFQKGALGRTRLVARPPIHEALVEVRPLRAVSGAARIELLERPERFLRSPAVNLEHFSEAVARAGIRRFRATATVDGSHASLRLESELGEAVVEVPLALHSLESFQREAKERIASGQLSMEVAGHLVRLEPALVEQIEEQLEALSSPPVQAPVEVPQEKQSSTETVAPLVGGVPCEPAERPASLSPHVDLLPHQWHGLAWLQTLVRNGLARGALLADDMGLGKTLQVWAFLEWYRERHPNRGPILLVLPAGLMDNWVEEYEKFFRGTGHLAREQIQRLHGGVAPQHLAEFPVVLTTYETMRNRSEELGRIRWSVLVADEAQKAKNPAARTTQALKSLAARFRVAVTGTPVENGLADLWCLVDFAERGKLGAQKEFLDDHVPTAESQFATLAERIAERANPCFLRRRKQDYLEGLPERHLHFIQLPMTARQQADYLSTLREHRAQHLGRQGLMDLLIRLRQICCVADGVEAGLSPGEAAEASCKVAWTLEKLREIRERGEKALVFVEYKHLQRLLVALLEREFGIPVGMINGDVQATGCGGALSPRRQILDRFARTAGFSVLVLSPLAAGVGLTIVEANHVLHFTRHWNPAREDQATDRVYRIGQERTVHVYHPIAIGSGFTSLDERLHELLEAKRRLQESALFPVVSSEVDMGFLAGLVEAEAQDPLQPVRWEDVERMDPGTLRRFACALYARMGWTVHRLGNEDGPDACGHRGEEAIALACCAAGEPPDLAKLAALGRRDPRECRVLITLDSAPEVSCGVQVVHAAELRTLLDHHPVTWDDLLSYLPPEHSVCDARKPPTQAAPPLVTATWVAESDPPPAAHAGPAWLEHLATALADAQDVAATRLWLHERLAPWPEVAARLPEVARERRRVELNSVRFRVPPGGEVDLVIAPAGRRWKVYLREGLSHGEEVHLYLHAFAHRLLGHLRDGDTWGHWDRVGEVGRRWDREAEELLRGRT